MQRGKRKITDLGRKHFVSAKALSDILQDIEASGLPSSLSASSYARHRKEIVNQETAYGKIIVDITLYTAAGSQVVMPFANPLAQLLLGG